MFAPKMVKIWKPNAQFTISRSIAQLKFIGAGWVPKLLTTFMFCAIYVPYIIVIMRKSLPPLLPFVSQAAGSPPQSGVFSIFLSLTAVISVFGLLYLYMAVELFAEKTEDKDSRKLLKRLNRALTTSGSIGILGMIITGGYPYDFYRYHEDWAKVTVFPHMIGATSLFAGGICFCSFFTYTMSIIFPDRKKLYFSRIALISACTFGALLHSVTVYDVFIKEYYDGRRLESCYTHYFEFDSQYLVASVSEWILVTCFVCFFITVQEETKTFCCSFSITIDETLGGKETKNMSTISNNNNECVNEKKDTKKLEKEVTTCGD